MIVKIDKTISESMRVFRQTEEGRVIAVVTVDSGLGENKLDPVGPEHCFSAFEDLQIEALRHLRRRGAFCLTGQAGFQPAEMQTEFKGIAVTKLPEPTE